MTGFPLLTCRTPQGRECDKAHFYLLLKVAKQSDRYSSNRRETLDSLGWLLDIFCGGRGAGRPLADPAARPQPEDYGLKGRSRENQYGARQSSASELRHLHPEVLRGGVEQGVNSLRTLRKASEAFA
jgi:hypothetical protein